MEYLALHSLDGGILAMSNGTNIASASLPLECVTGSSTQPRLLGTCVSSFSPVQPQNIEDLRTWLAQASHASPSAMRASDAVPATSEICGPQQQMSFAWYDPESSCWRTSQGCLLAGMQESSSPTWPAWGMWANGAAYELPKPELGTTEPGGGWLPTPVVAMRRGSSEGALTRRNGRSRKKDRLDYAVEGDGKSGRLNPEWVDWLVGWPIGWTALQPLETHKFQEWLQQHGDY